MQNGICILVVVRIAVIEGDQHGVVRQFGALGQRRVKLLRRDRMEIMFHEIGHLPVEILRKHGKRDVHAIDLMIIEHDDLRGLRVFRPRCSQSGLRHREKKRQKEQDQNPFQ